MAQVNVKETNQVKMVYQRRRATVTSSSTSKVQGEKVWGGESFQPSKTSF